MKFGHEVIKSESLDAGTISVDPITDAWVFEAGKDLSNLFLLAYFLVVKVVKATFLEFTHYCREDHARVQDRYFRGSVLLNRCDSGRTGHVVTLKLGHDVNG